MALLAWSISVFPAGAEPIERTTRKGPVEATVRLEPGHLKIGDVVTLTLRVVAEEGVELLMSLFGSALERFAILDFATNEALDEDGRGLPHRRIVWNRPNRAGRVCLRS